MSLTIRAARAALVLMASTVCGSTALADPPGSSYIFPAGGQRGTTVQCRVGGLELSAECGLRMIGPGVEAPAKISSMPTLVLVGPFHHNPIAQQPWEYPKDMAAAIKIAADAPLGVRLWYCTTSEGATQLRPFVVGDLPEVLEDEEKTALGRPQQVTVPATINGRIYPRADLDEYAIDAKGGQHVSCEVLSQRLGHKLDAKLELRDGAGKLIAEGDDRFGRDSLLVATIPADGRYVLRVHDIALEGDQDYVYRLSIRTGPYVTHVYPAGGRRGSTVPLRLFGSGVGADGFADERVALSFESLPASERPTTASGLTAVPGTAMSSLIAAGAAQPGGFGAARPGTPAGSSASGSTLAKLLPAGSHVGCPLQLSDGPEVIEAEPNDDAEHGQRVAFPGVVNGQIQSVGDVDEFVFAAVKGQKLDIEFFGRRLGSPIVGVWTVLDSQGKQLARHEGETRLNFVAPADGDFTLRVHELHRETHGGSEYIYRLVATPTQPDFRLVLERDNVGVAPAQTAKIKLSAIRVGGFAGDIQLATSDLPAGVTFAPSTIAGNQNQIELAFTAAKDSPIGDTHRSLVIGAAVADGQRLLRTAEVPPAFAAAGSGALGGGYPVDSLAVTVTHPPLFSIDTEEVYGAANRGATFVQKFTIERQPGFDGEIVLSPADRQARYLQGATGPTVVVKPGEKEVLYPVFFPEVMDLNRTARVLLKGTAKVTDSAGRVHFVTSTTKKQVVVRVSPSILTLACDLPLLEAARGQTVQVPLRVGRTPELTGPVKVAAVLPPEMKGITAASASVSDGEEHVTLAIQLAADAQLAHHDRLVFQATGQRGGQPVVAEASVEIELVP